MTRRSRRDRRKSQTWPLNGDQPGRRISNRRELVRGRRQSDIDIKRDRRLSNRRLEDFRPSILHD